jgi:uncharacterized protein YkwD
MPGHRCLIALVLLPLLAEPGAAAEPRKPALTVEQRKELQGLIVEYRKARAEPDLRLEVIDRMAKLGPIGLTNLLEVINQELGKQLTDYRQAFSKAAGAIIAKRTEVANLQEIALLRKVVLDLSKEEGLTKEQIVEKSDPALAKLKTLILLSPQEILAANPPLAKRRETLGTLGSQWEKCATLLLQAQAAAEKANDAAETPASEPSPAAQPVGRAEQPEESPPATAPSFSAYLAKEEEIGAALAMPMDPQTRAVLAHNSQFAGKLDPEEARCVLDLNLTRNLLGLAALRVDLALTATARDHSSDMATHNFFAHESPVPGKKDPWERAKRFGTTASGENIAVGTLDGAVANEMWWHSPGHHKNMLGEHTRVGLGKHGRHWTELFGK